MARGVPGGGASWEDGRKGRQSRAGMEATPRHPIRLLVSLAFSSPPGSWGAAVN